MTGASASPARCSSASHALGASSATAGVAFGDCDHAQQFGLPEPVNGAMQSDRLLCNKTIQQVIIREDSGDLTIKFTDQTSLEILNTSSSYEGWELGDGAGLHVIATGGGELAIWAG